MAVQLEMGLDTFGDVTFDLNGKRLPQAQVIRNVVGEGVLADQLGLDFFGVGEHHRDDFAVSAPEVVLAAVAAQTKKIRLGSAVTVLSSDDPIRVFQRFSTIDAISNGRAEVIMGRGSFIESFPLFGFDLEQYEELFEEKLDLFAQILKGNPVNWSGNTRVPVAEQSVYPQTEGKLRTWIGVGGTPKSVLRAAHYGFPLMLAIIGGDPKGFKPFVDLYYKSLSQFNQRTQPIGVHSPGFVAKTDQEAKETIWPHYQTMMNRIGRDRGWPPISKEQFIQQLGSEGSLYVGSPETVAEKIATTVKHLGVLRFDLKYSLGTLPHEDLMKCIELYGTKVVPLVREKLAQK
ncbi:LLM class flavin-dependent oxidoreductase [Bdellovibrio sp. KM01]|uniref:LLM class flavin-dependent oxidoreductase n=1 Tax=Bdellovibrio sp. KM01 TaxID=2748865 RepID=UPI0015EA7745|nr:LLM class flavin-dependent oxidoreductase [Bdellovibrio sp. KM01]QLY26605.1 LLM class flavin-dependent oxidoreductase [Bdellovibrio sp. KM01]